MCNHRTEGRWGRVWDAWGVAALGSFAALETYGLVTEGSDATLSTYLRRRAGLLVPCRHTRWGRLFLIGFAVWLVAHIGWGKFGVGVRRPRQQCTVRRNRV